MALVRLPYQAKSCGLRRPSPLRLVARPRSRLFHNAEGSRVPTIALETGLLSPWKIGRNLGNIRVALLSKPLQFWLRRCKRPRSRTSSRGGALADHRCRTRTWVCARSCSRPVICSGHPNPTREQAGALQSSGRLGFPLADSEHSSRGNPTNGPWRSESSSYPAERDNRIEATPRRRL